MSNYYTNSMDEPLKYYAEHKKSETNSIYHLIQFIWHSRTGITNSSGEKKLKQVIASKGVGSKGLTRKGHKQSFLGWWKHSVF